MAIFKRYRKQKDGSKVPYWYIRYWVNREEKWEAVGKVGEVTKAVAQKALEEMKRMVRLGQWDMIGATIPTLEEFSQEYIVYQRDVKQKRSWKKDVDHLKRWNTAYGNRRLSDISAKDIDDYKQLRLVEVKASTVNR
jgi:hypothetical protein